MKKLILPLIFFFGIQFMNAQNSESREKRIVQAEPQSIQAKVVDAEQSDYFGFDNKIKSMTLENNIPNNFPTRQNYADKNAYLLVANEWLKAHQSLIREEYKNTTLKD